MLYNKLMLVKNIFMGGMINSSAGILPHCLSGEFASSADVALLYNMQFCKSKTAWKNIFWDFQIPAKYFYGRRAKQFDADSISLFIYRVCLIGKHRIIVWYAVLQKQNCLKKLFSEAEASCKKFLWRIFLWRINNLLLYFCWLQFLFSI